MHRDDDARPLYVGSGDRAAFGLLHPAAAPARDVAVLLVAPFGWEDMCSYRARRTWAGTLSDAGYPVLRLDLPATGDAGGDATDEDLVATWMLAIGAAAARLRTLTGCRRVAAVGPGFGGLLTTAAVAAGAAIDDLALWGVPASGRRLVRELRAFALVERSALDGAAWTGAAPPADDADGLVVAGYLLAPATQAALEALDLSTITLPGAVERHVLLLERDGRAVDAPLEAMARASGAAVTVAPGPGYAQMLMVEPQESRPAPATLQTVLRWLAGFAAAADGTPDPPAPASAPSLDLVADGQAIRETPLTFAHAFGTPFGVLTEPVGALTPATHTIVLLNAGPQRRAGPNRMWVEAARRWAARGVPALRVDLAGIGDAAGDGTRFDDVPTFYRPEYLDQVRAVLDVLEARGLPPRFIIAGLCAGGWWALETTVDDARVDAAILFNPGSLLYDGGWKRTLLEARVLARKALAPESWRRAVRGDTTFSIHARTLRRLTGGLARTAARLLARLVRGAGPAPAAPAVVTDPLDARLDRLRDDDRRLTLVFAGAEPVHRELVTTGQAARLDRWPNVTLEHIDVDGDLHTLRPLWLQRHAHRLIDEAVARELARATSPTPS